MKYGIFDHLDRSDAPLTQFYEERIQLVEEAEKLGISSYHLAEHHWNPVGMAPLPGIFLGAIAKRTKTIRLGPLAYALAFHNPLILAEEICMLDHMSNGRLDLGVGRGISPWELALFGVTPPETRDMFFEAMDIIMMYFTQDMVTHRGTHWQYYDVPVEIKPLQKPFPPIWYGSTSGATRDYLAGLGSAINAGWAPNNYAKQSLDAYNAAWEKNKDAKWRAQLPKTPTLGSVRMVVIAETDKEAQDLIRPAHDRWYASLEKLANSFGFRALFLAPNFELAQKYGYVIAGTPDTVRAQLATHIEETGINYLLLQLAFGNLTQAQYLRTLKLFATEVMPKLPRESAAKVGA
jgi:alkanesulfonate monooxygenase SsuD/methylene tetrahydromethanopterin reductase-like flavin-dependent oxidoreductase (luciferase family)